MSEPIAEHREDQRVYNQPLSEDVSYQLTPRTAPVDPSDIETGEAAVEVVILWGELSILHVAHLSPPRAFCVGDATTPATDFLIGSESLGTDRLPIVVEHGSGVAVVIPAGAAGEITLGQQVVSFEELAAQELLLPGGVFPLPLGAAARIQYRGFAFLVNQTSAARRVGVGVAERRSLKDQAWTIASVLLHSSLLVAFQFLPPHSSALSVDLLNADSRLVSYFDQPLEKLDEEKPQWLAENADAEGGTGKAHAEERGEMGKPEQARTHNKYAIKGPADNPQPQMARNEAKLLAATGGIIGLLQQNASPSPTSIFGAAAAQGRDLADAIGAITGDQIGANSGFNGLDGIGTGRGGGGDGRGTIGVGTIGTVGHGNGTGGGDGWGSGAAGPLRGHSARVPKVHSNPPDIHGSLSKESIRRVITLHINEVRHCYSQELNTHPDLQGRVSVKFIISPTGTVQAAVAENSDLGNAKVEQCVALAVRRWPFPAPEGGGLVIVSYPFVFSQTGN